VIGIQYAVTALVSSLRLQPDDEMMRWQLAYPGQALPLIGNLLGETAMPGGVMAPEFYNQLAPMHGTIMVFMGVVPLAVGGSALVVRWRSARRTWVPAPDMPATGCSSPAASRWSPPSS